MKIPVILISFLAASTLLGGTMELDTNYFEVPPTVKVKPTKAGITNLFGMDGTTNKYLAGDGVMRTLPAGGAGGGNVTNTGASVVGYVPVYTDTSGGSITPTNTLNLLSASASSLLIGSLGIGTRSTITHAGGNIIIDLSLTNRYWSCSVTGNCSILLTNASAGNWGNILLRMPSSNCIPTFTFVPSGSVSNWFGGAPSTFTANTIGSLSLYPIDSTTNSTLASYVETQ